MSSKGKLVVIVALAVLTVPAVEAFSLLGTVAAQKIYYGRQRMPCQGFAPSAKVIAANVGFLYGSGSPPSYLAQGGMIPRLLPHRYISAVDREGQVNRGRLWINAQGLVKNNSDVSDEEELREGDVVVVVSGGSTVAGYGMERNEDTLPAQLERWLRENVRLGPGQRVRVLNAGVPGYGAFHELLSYLGRLSLFSPKPIAWVELNGVNEERNPAAYRPQTLFVEEGDMRFRYQPLANFSPFLPATQAFWFGWLPALLRSGPKPPPVAKAPDPGAVSGLAEKYLETIRRARVLAEGLGTRYLFFFQPNTATDERKPPEAEREYMARYFPEACWRGFSGTIQRFAGEVRRQLNGAHRHAASFDLSGAFRGIDGVELYFDSNHYSREGNRILAERIGKSLATTVFSASAARRP